MLYIDLFSTIAIDTILDRSNTQNLIEAKRSYSLKNYFLVKNTLVPLKVFQNPFIDHHHHPLGEDQSLLVRSQLRTVSSYFRQL